MNILGVPLWFTFYHEGAQRGFTKEHEEMREKLTTKGARRGFTKGARRDKGTEGQRDKKIRVIRVIGWGKNLGGTW